MQLKTLKFEPHSMIKSTYSMFNPIYCRIMPCCPYLLSTNPSYHMKEEHSTPMTQQNWPGLTTWSHGLLFSELPVFGSVRVGGWKMSQQRRLNWMLQVIGLFITFVLFFLFIISLFFLELTYSCLMEGPFHQYTLKIIMLFSL